MCLAFVAFLPIPSAVPGRYSDNTVAVVVYAIFVGLVSALEAVLVVVAWRDGLYRVRVSPQALRWSVAGALVPVGAFVLSVPLACVRPWLGIVTWFVSFPAELVLNRLAPSEIKAMWR